MTSNLSDIKRTSEGYLQNYDDWTPEIAEDIAAELNISLTPERWFVINFLRNFYDKYHTSPSIRALVTALKRSWRGCWQQQIFAEAIPRRTCEDSD